jgi:hypothetical protein
VRQAHRYIAVFAVFIGLFIATTGLIVQTMDLGALLGGAPATNPTIKSIHSGLDGPPNFKVIRTPDYAASALPAGFDFDRALATTLGAARGKFGDVPFSFLELRMDGNRPIGRIGSKGQQYSFDLATGAAVGGPSPIVFEPNSTPSTRGTVKDIHRMRWFGGWGVFVDALFGLVICAMLFTGLRLYFQLLKARRRMKRKSLFWKAGGWWRTLHRGTSIVAAAFLIVIATSGTILSISSMGVVIADWGKGRPGLKLDVSAPLIDADLPHLLHNTLDAFAKKDPGAGVKVIRLRYFAGMAQGIVLSGADTHQYVFDAITGREAWLYEHGYPETGQTFGWQADETFKMIHRGDYFGLPGRIFSLLSGLGLLYLCISGALMYWELYRSRRARGKKAVFWK